MGLATLEAEEPVASSLILKLTFPSRYSLPYGRLGRATPDYGFLWAGKRL